MSTDAMFDPFAVDGGEYQPDDDHRHWARRVQVCKRSVCLLYVAVGSQQGTGWVVRNDKEVAALVTAGHLVQQYVGVDNRLTTSVTATFGGRQVIDLKGCRVLHPAMSDAGAGGPPLLDAAVIVLERPRLLPGPPVPCLLLNAATKLVGGRDECTMLHHAGGHGDVVISPRGRLLDPGTHGPYAESPWIAAHDTMSAGGSSGGMLVDHRCLAFAIHISRAGAAVKGAVLLGAVHAALGASSPWVGVDSLEHRACVDFHLPPISPWFVGRVSAMEDLTRLVRDEGPSLVVCTGLPGVGKSCVVTTWANQMFSSGVYELVAWLRADSLANLQADLVALGDHLSLPLSSATNASVAQQAATVTRSLENSSYGPTLLVFDNLDDWTAVQHLVPTAVHCSCVLTARSRLHFANERVLPLGPLHADESLGLLGLLAGHAKVTADPTTAKQLCVEVGHLPLAVAQLGSHARDGGERLADVLSAVRARSGEVHPLANALADCNGGDSVLAALRVVQQPSHLDEASRRCLQRLAVLAPDRVPRELLGPDGGTRKLAELALVSYPEDGLVSVHRLVQLVAREAVGEDLVRVSEELLTALCEYTEEFSQHKRDTWAPMRAIVAHAEALHGLGQVPVPGGVHKCLGDVWFESASRMVVYCISCISDYPSARRWADLLLEYAGGQPEATMFAAAQRARVHICQHQHAGALSLCSSVRSRHKEALGERHRAVLAVEQEMVLAMREQGNVAGARALLEELVRKQTETLGEGHSRVAAVEYELADVMRIQGELAEARVLLSVVVRKEAAALGEEHVDVARSQHKLAMVLRDQKELEGARTLLEEVVRKKVAALGDEHLGVARSEQELAMVLRDTGELDIARALLSAAVRKKVAALGNQHVEVLASQRALTSLLRGQGQLDDAQALLEEVVQKEEAAFGEEHICVARSEHELAMVLRNKGKLDEARALLAAVVQKKVVALGDEHLEVARSQHELAVVLRGQGQLDEARPLLTAVVRKKVAALGDGHVDVARSEFELALVLRSQGELVEAQALLTAVVRKEAVAFGERHLCVARSEHELAMVLRKKGSLDEARALLTAVVQKKVAALGDKHLDVARSQHELAMVLRGLGEPDDARALLQLALSTVVGCKGNEDAQAVAIREDIADLEGAPS